jgi:hypothetical protein
LKPRLQEWPENDGLPRAPLNSLCLAEISHRFSLCLDECVAAVSPGDAPPTAHVAHPISAFDARLTLGADICACDQSYGTLTMRRSYRR